MVTAGAYPYGEMRDEAAADMERAHVAKRNRLCGLRGCRDRQGKDGGCN
jgi:hypothetical protein